MATATARKLVLKMSVSLDGFVSGPNGEIDWIFRTLGDAQSESMKWIVQTLGTAGVHIMGSRTYYDMAAFWPTSDSPLAPVMNDIPKVIFSRSGIKNGIDAARTTRALVDANNDGADSAGHRTGIKPTAAVLNSWTEPAVAGGDLAEEMVRLKAQPGKFILAHGGARFAQSLVSAGLIDEYRLVVHPLALGRGQPLFCGLQHPLDLRLLSATPFASGVVAAVYQRFNS